MDVSIVIPLYNESESLEELNEWINKSFIDHSFSYEIIYIDDGSNDRSWKIIEEIAKRDNNVKGISFNRNYGKSQALRVGFDECEGKYVATLDADLQDSPEEIPALYEMITNQDFDLVSGWKKKRHDPLSKTIPTKLYNWAARRITGIFLHDFNCGLKAYKKSVVKSIELYGDMHRYVPALAKYAGFTNIGEKVVQHQARKFGVTKFGLNRFLNGPLDLITVAFMGKFGKKPMHFFGALGSLMFLIGFLLIFYLGVDKIFIHQNARLLADRTEFYVALIAMVIGVQFFMTGFISELIGRNATHRNVYLIEKRIGAKSNEA